MLVELLDDVGVRQHVGGASHGINIGEWVEAVRPGSLHLCPSVYHLLMDGYCNGARVRCWVSSRSTDQVVNQNVVGVAEAWSAQIVDISGDEWVANLQIATRWLENHRLNTLIHLQLSQDVTWPVAVANNMGLRVLFPNHGFERSEEPDNLSLGQEVGICPPADQSRYTGLSRLAPHILSDIFEQSMARPFQSVWDLMFRFNGTGSLKTIVVVNKPVGSVERGCSVVSDELNEQIKNNIRQPVATWPSGVLYAMSSAVITDQKGPFNWDRLVMSDTTPLRGHTSCEGRMTQTTRDATFGDYILCAAEPLITAPTFLHGSEQQNAQVAPPLVVARPGCLPFAYDGTSVTAKEMQRTVERQAGLHHGRPPVTTRFPLDPVASALTGDDALLRAWQNRKPAVPPNLYAPDERALEKILKLICSVKNNQTSSEDPKNRSVSSVPGELRFANSDILKSIKNLRQFKLGIPVVVSSFAGSVSACSAMDYSSPHVPELTGFERIYRNRPLLSPCIKEVSLLCELLINSPPYGGNVHLSSGVGFRVGDDVPPPDGLPPSLWAVPTPCYAWTSKYRVDILHPSPFSEASLCRRALVTHEDRFVSPILGSLFNSIAANLNAAVVGFNLYLTKQLLCFPPGSPPCPFVTRLGASRRVGVSLEPCASFSCAPATVQDVAASLSMLPCAGLEPRVADLAGLEFQVFNVTPPSIDVGSAPAGLAA